MKRALSKRILILFLAVIILSGGDNALAEFGKEAGLHALIKEFIRFFNNKDIESILGLYDDNARIVTRIGDKRVTVSKADYRVLLEEKLKSLPYNLAVITGYSIDRLLFSRERIDFTVNFKGRLAFLTSHEKYRVVAKRKENRWRIVKEYSLLE